MANDMDSETTSHVVELERVPSRRHQVRFRGRCSCGATSNTFTTAGMVWGWEARHRETAPRDSDAT